MGSLGPVRLGRGEMTSDAGVRLRREVLEVRRWDRLVNRYLEEYAARGLEASTMSKVGSELDRWGSWLKRRRPRPKLEDVDADLLTKYLQSRAAFRSKWTVSGVLSVMRGMGAFLVREGVWSQSPLRWMKGPKVDARSRVPRRIARETMRALWQAAATHRHGYGRYLWLAVVACLYGAGLRRQELVGLDVSDWVREEGVVRTEGRKVGRERCVPVSDMVARCLEVYLVQRHNHLERLGGVGEPALFVNRYGARLKPEAVNRGIGALARRSGVGRVTPHAFRHTCASDLLEAGASLPEVQRLLGHRRLTTTMRYVEVADRQRHEAVKRHPVNEFLETGGES